MSNLLGEQLHKPPEAFTREELTAECLYQADNPTGNDPYVGAFAVAAAIELQREKLDDVLQFTQSVRAVLPPTPRDVINLLRPAMQKQILRRDPEGFPTQGYYEPTKWQEHIEETVSGSASWEELMVDLTTRNIQSNIGDRYKSHKLLMTLLRDRLGPAPRLLDIGCSELHGPRKLASTIPFGKVEVLRSDTGQRREKDPDATVSVNELLGRPDFKLGTAVGVDEAPADIRSGDKRHGEWIAACSLRPQELENEARKQEFARLHNLHPPNVHSYWGSFSRQGMARFLRESPEQEFEVVTFTTMLYQLPHRDRLEAQALAREYVAPNGVIIYQDHAQPHRQDATALKFFPRWTAFKYRTMIEFADDPSHTAHEVFQWETSRCERLRFGPALPALLVSSGVRVQ